MAIATASPTIARILEIADDDLIAVDVARRLYIGLSRDRSDYHVIQPARAAHPLVKDGAVEVGALVCTCPAGTYSGHCYRLEQAVAFEAATATLDAAPEPPGWNGAGASVEAARG